MLRWCSDSCSLLRSLLVLVLVARFAHAAVLPATTYAQLVAAASAATAADTVLLSASFAVPSIIALPAGANLTIAGAPGGCSGGFGGLCTLDGGGASSHFSLAAASGGLAAAALTLRGVALINGYSATNSGGAIYTNLGSSLTLVNCLLDNHVAYRNGGAIGDSAASVTLVNTSITRSTARLGNGGGVSTIFAPVGSPGLSVTLSTFTLNSAATNGGGLSSGGALFVRGCTFINNTAGGQGGGAWAGATASVTLSTFAANGASASGGGLAAMGNLALNGSALLANAAGSNGGGLLLSGGNVTVTDTRLVGNLALYVGGGCISSALGVASLALARVTVANCTARMGGGLLANGGAVTMSACVLAGNQAAGPFPRGGGLSFEGSGSVTATNTVFSDNSVLVYAASNAQLPPALGAGALAINTAAVSQLIGSLAAGLARTGASPGLSTSSGYGGGLHAYAYQGGAVAVTLANASFVRNIAPQGGALAAGASAPGFAAGRTSLAVAGSTFAANVAQGDGGAAYLLNNVSAAFTSCTFGGGSAGGSGGVLRLDGTASATSLSACSMTGNVAYNFGGALAASGGAHTVTAAGLSVVNNTAAVGGAFYWATPPAGAPQLSALASLSGVTASGNAALSGALHGYDPFVNASALVQCVGCTLQASGVPLPSTSSSDAAAELSELSVAAAGTPPVALALAGAALVVPPAGELSQLRVTLQDAFGQLVPAWPGVTVHAALLPAGITDTRRETLLGSAAASITGGAASFQSLLLHGFVNATYKLRASAAWSDAAWMTRLGPAAAALLAAATADANAVVATCAPLQAFDPVSMVCVCTDNASPGVGPASAACACNAGFTADAANASCVTCPGGVTCDDGGYIYTNKGFWRASAWDTAAFTCPSADWCGPTSAPGAQAANCSVGHAGPLCAVCCAPGVAGCDPAGPVYSLQAQQCVACDAGAPFSAWPRWKRAVLLFFVAVITVVLLFFAFFIALLPGAAAAGFRFVSRLQTIVRNTRHVLFGGPKIDKKSELASASSRLVVMHRASERIRSGTSQKLPLTELVSEDDGALSAPDVASDATLASKPEDVDQDDTDLGSERVRHERRKHNFLVLRERLLSAAQPIKVIINFLQVVMTLPKTLRVRWPRVFYAIAARLSVVNINLLSLPSLSCANPDPSYFTVFHGYTLGLASAWGFLGAVYLVGRVIHARAARAPGADVARERRRLYRFTNRVVTAVLMITYYAYPSVTSTVLGMFSCQILPDGHGGYAQYLTRDYRVECYTAKHKRYVAAAAFYTIFYAFGIPVAFWLLLRYFGVARMARERVAAAWLCSAADWAARHANLACPPGLDTRRLTAGTIPDEYLTALWKLYCREVPDEESKLAAGSGSSAGGRKPRLSWINAARGLRARLSGCSSVAGGADADADEPLPSREEQLAELLRWCARSDVLTIPALQWPIATRLHEQHQQAYARAAPPLPPSPAEEHAENRIGFLFEAYHVDCYYFEVIELCRKLLLTGVMALVRPGSVAQIVMGLLVAFAAVVLYVKLAPYAARGVNRLSFVAQVNVWLFLLVALLLQIRVDGTAEDSRMYNGIVGTLALWIFIVPLLNKILEAFSDNVEADNGGMM